MMRKATLYKRSMPRSVVSVSRSLSVMKLGRFHLFATVMMIFGFGSGQYITQLLAYLEIPNKYLCSNFADHREPYYCEPHFNEKNNAPGFCGKEGIYHWVDWSKETSIYNWYTQLNMECISKARVGLIGSSIFIGWTIAAFIIPRQADIHGRRKIFMFSMAIQSVTFLALYFSHDVNFTTVLMFIFGVASVGRCSISFLYLMELLPSNTQIIAGTCLQVHNSLLALFACIYFWVIWKNWLGIEIMAGLMGAIGGLGAFFMPESPKFLISKGRFDEARNSINVIARYNKQNEFHGEFDREVTDRKTKSIIALNNSNLATEITNMGVNHNSALMSPK
jgi:MFS family permease